MRFAEPARAAATPEEALEHLVATGELVLTEHGEGEAGDGDGTDGDGDRSPLEGRQEPE
jgi:hypothetical protein